MVKNFAFGWLRKMAIRAFGLCILLVIGYCVSDHKDYPGKAEFQEPNTLITTNTKGSAHGNSDAAKLAAAEFASKIKTLQAALFTGSTGKLSASGGDFVTYCRHNPDSVAFIVHVPGLRNYKKAEAREALAMLAWRTANEAAAQLQFTSDSPSLILGLRGFGSYGPIWSGKRGGQPEVKSDDIDEVRRLYPFFVQSAESK